MTHRYINKQEGYPKENGKITTLCRVPYNNWTEKRQAYEKLQTYASRYPDCWVNISKRATRKWYEENTGNTERNMGCM